MHGLSSMRQRAHLVDHIRLALEADAREIGQRDVTVFDLILEKAMYALRMFDLIGLVCSTTSTIFIAGTEWRCFSGAAKRHRRSGYPGP